MLYSYPFKYHKCVIQCGLGEETAESSYPLSVREGDGIVDNVRKWIEFKKKLKEEWKKLWKEKFNDKFRGEGVAIRNYPLLFVDQGTVIVATRDCKPPSFSEVVQSWAENFSLLNPSQVLPPHPSVGGWGKFIKTYFRKSQSKRKVMYEEPKPKRDKLQLKKGGRGWLHSF